MRALSRVKSTWALGEMVLGPTLFSVCADVTRNLTGLWEASKTLDGALLTGDTLNVHQRLTHFSSHIHLRTPKAGSHTGSCCSGHIHVSAGQFLQLFQILLFYFIWPGVTHPNAQIQSWLSYFHLTALSFPKQNFPFFPMQHRPT